FVGLERPPLIRNDQPGTWVTLTMDRADGLNDGAPILFRGVAVGRIENLRLDDSSDRVLADGFIEAPHDRRLTSATVFWDTSGFSVSFGAQGLSLNVNSLTSVLQGGVAFETLASGGRPVEPQQLFTVQPDEATARNLLFTGAEDIQPLQLDMVIEDSLRGLTRGADVLYQGLRVGQVSDLALVTIEAEDGAPELRQLVTLSILPSRLGMDEDATAEDALEFLSSAVEGGLRARVASAGFLGTSLIVELVDIPGVAPDRLDRDAQPNPLIPSVPGDLEDFSATAQGFVDRIGRLPIEELMNSARDMLDGITAIVTDQDTRAIPNVLREAIQDGRLALSDVAAITSDLRENNSGETLAQVLADASAAFRAVSEAAVDVPEMVERIDAAAAAVEEFGFAQVSAQIEGILADLRAMLGSEDAEQLPRNLSNTLEAATGLLTDLRDGNAAGNLNNALRSASGAADEIARSAQQLPQLIQRLQATAARADGVLGSYGDRSAFNNEVIGTLRELRRATEAFGSLARMIERNPRAFILGR
ncbi:MAG: MlaD family protein, partial [Paracoccus sp. (in: a-proteobacteria)]|nr:MlaD family protein [Paracoccus sp. (in: a-proteobacteria)]